MFSAPPARERVLRGSAQACQAESIILSAPSGESVMFSAPPARERVLRGSAQACQAESIILSAGSAESMILSLRAESIILSAGGAESMILSTRAESIILSAPPAESMMLSASQKHCYRRVFFVLQTCVFLLSPQLSMPTGPELLLHMWFSKLVVVGCTQSSTTCRNPRELGKINYSLQSGYKVVRYILLVTEWTISHEQKKNTSSQRMWLACS